MVTACIVLLYASYSIPVVCLLVRGRENVRHGPFWLGGFGLFSNVVLLLWTAFTFVMYSFPPVRPVVAGSESCPAPTFLLFLAFFPFFLVFTPYSIDVSLHSTSFIIRSFDCTLIRSEKPGLIRSIRG